MPWEVCETVFGHAAREIVKNAQEHIAGVIILGSRGRSDLTWGHARQHRAQGDPPHWRAGAGGPLKRRKCAQDSGRVSARAQVRSRSSCPAVQEGVRFGEQSGSGSPLLVAVRYGQATSAWPFQ